jgi:methyl-accepting chemotaxis protein WspA
MMIASIDELGVQVARNEIRGLEYYRPLITLVHNVQQHRTLATARAAGIGSLEGDLAGKRLDIESDLAAVDRIDQAFENRLGTTERWTALKAATRDLLTGGIASSAPADVFKLHSAVIEDAISLIGVIGDASKVSLDPEIDTYYMLNFLILKGPELGDVLSQARGLGAVLSAPGAHAPAERAELVRLAALAAFLQKRLDKSLGKALSANDALRSQLESAIRASSAAVRTASDQIAEQAARPASTAGVAAYASTVSRGIESIFDLELAVAGHARQVLDARVGLFQRQLLIAMVWTIAGLLVVSVIGFAIARDITVTLTRVVEIANNIALGDIGSHTVAAARRDELGVLSRAFDRMAGALEETVGVAERIAAGDLSATIAPRSDRDALALALGGMIEKLSKLVGEVQRSGIQVNASVNEIAATARQQQATATEIAATTAQVGATSREISATSRELGRTMAEVAAVADQAADLASSGQAGVTRMGETMQHVMDAASAINMRLGVLNEKAGNINQVVTTITKVADQTNLLSLNAAIEAEKAGEYGRGFAVVATEIRRLADQTAVATYDIEQMVKEVQAAVSAGVMGMDKFAEEVRRGMHEIQQVSGQLSAIIEQVQALAPRFEAVSEGMQAQTTGAEQITQALAQLTDSVQQTVESLRQSSQVIDGLNQAAVDMRSGVSRFKLVA